MGVSEIYKATSIDRSLKLEKDLDNQLMHLSLVDICGAHNKRFKLDMQLDEKGRLLFCNNAVINHIFNSNCSFKLIQQIIKMKSPNFLKPYQLSTVMSYIERCYHSNDD